MDALWQLMRTWMAKTSLADVRCNDEHITSGDLLYYDLNTDDLADVNRVTDTAYDSGFICFGYNGGQIHTVLLRLRHSGSEGLDFFPLTWNKGTAPMPREEGP